jgi:flagellar hook assembly protein FlgD
VGIGDEPETLPQKLTLAQNYPNPFNPATTIRYEIPARLEGFNMILKIYNNLGQEVRTLVNGAQEPGIKSIVWDGKNDLGQAVSSGIYLYRLRVGNEILTKKMLLLK